MPVSDPASSASATLRLHGLSPRKRLGQNFLRDRSFLPRIVNAGDIQAEDAVLEIGAGTGILTEAIAAQAARLMAIELDDSLVDILRARYESTESVEIWHGNAMDFDPCAHFTEPYKLVANIPYYITGPLIRHFLESTCPPERLVLMVQREVAERMAARPGDLSLLGVSVQFYATVELVARVPAGAFYPRPKVDSALVCLAPFRRREGALPDSFFTVARAGFGQKRKQIANALAAGLGISRERASALLEEAGIDPHVRAEDVPLEAWLRLAEARLRSNTEGT